MNYKIIEGKQEVINEARNQIDTLVSEIEYMIKGAESEHIFHIIYLFSNLFASLAKQYQTNAHYSVYNITWLRAITGLTLALNEILPKFLPLKPLTRLDAGEFEKTFRENLFLPS